MIQPMVAQTLEAFRESDADLSREVMSRHREVKARTDDLVETAMKDPESGREATYYCIGARNLRRISAHLSNIVSGIANPFDLLGRNE
jgi:phosphate uptake regulator